MALCKELRDKIRRINSNYDQSEKHLQERNMHLSEHSIFTNDAPPKCRYVGSIGKDFDVDSIVWDKK